MNINSNYRLTAQGFWRTGFIMRPVAAAVFLLLAAAPARAIMNGAEQDIFPATAIFQSSVTIPYRHAVNAGLTVSSGLYVSNGANDAVSALNVVGSFNLSTLSGTGAITAGLSNRGANYVQNGEAGWRNSYIIQRAGTQVAAIGTNGSPSTKLQLFTGASAADASARLTVDSLGNVGIGTASPAEKLDVVGSIQASSASFTTTGNAVINVGLRVSSSAYLATSGGSVGIGASSFDATNPEKLKVDAGTTSSFNVINAYGTINNYLQMNIKNSSTGGSASSDLVATADNGSESTNYVDMGINSSGYSDVLYTITGINDAYLYNMGGHMAIGTGTAAKAIKFFTAGTLTGNERMRIDATGNVGIGITAPGANLHISSTTASTTQGMLKITTGTVNADILTITGNGNTKIAGNFYGRRYTLTYAATLNVDWNNGNTQSVVLTASVTTLNFSNGQDGGKYVLMIKQGGTGSYTIPAAPASVRWPEGTGPTLTTTVGKTDYIGFIYNGVDSKYDAVAFTSNL